MPSRPNTSRNRSYSATINDKASLERSGNLHLDQDPTLSFLERLRFRIRRRVSCASNTILPSIQRILAYAAAVAFVLIASIHAITTLRYMSLPTSCRQPGMGVYLGTEYCTLLFSRMPMPDPAPDTPPSNGTFRASLPQPVYWADFERLYNLGIRMTENVFDALAFANPTMSKSLPGKMNEESPLDPLATEVCRTNRNHRKCSEVCDAIDLARNLRSRLGEAAQKTTLTLEALVNSNQRVAMEVEQAYDKQPKTFLEQIASQLLPRLRRNTPWTWDMDVELRWQFRRALTDFSTELDRSLALLNESLPGVRNFHKALEDLQALLENQVDDVEEGLDASDAAGNNWLERLENTSMLDGLAKESQAIADRLEEALATLGSINQELEGILHKVASPAPRIPWHEHLKHIYIADARLCNSLEKMGKR